MTARDAVTRANTTSEQEIELKNYQCSVQASHQTSKSEDELSRHIHFLLPHSLYLVTLTSGITFTSPLCHLPFSTWQNTAHQSFQILTFLLFSTVGCYKRFQNGSKRRQLHLALGATSPPSRNTKHDLALRSRWRHHQVRSGQRRGAKSTRSARSQSADPRRSDRHLLPRERTGEVD